MSSVCIEVPQTNNTSTHAITITLQTLAQHCSGRLIAEVAKSSTNE